MTLDYVSVCLCARMPFFCALCRSIQNGFTYFIFWHTECVSPRLHLILIRFGFRQLTIITNRKLHVYMLPHTTQRNSTIFDWTVQTKRVRYYHLSGDRFFCRWAAVIRVREFLQKTFSTSLIKSHYFWNDLTNKLKCSMPLQKYWND